ncbi:MAG: hypothetical protein KBS72_00660 [Bacteroidales bacterium]|nr:hypothetical protein [Candidatus Cacconaster scatequi]
MNRIFYFCLMAILPAILFALPGTSTARNIPAYPVDGPEGNFTVQYLVETDSSVILLCRYTPDSAVEGFPPYMKNISRKTRIVTEDGDYALLHTSHMPIRDDSEPRYAYLKAGHPYLNCTLEFEKFSYDGPFDLIEDDAESVPLHINGLKAGKEATAEVVTGEFLNGTPYSEYWYYYEAGMPVHHYDDGGIYFSASGVPHSSDMEDYFLSVDFEIVNRTEGPIQIKMNDMSAKALRMKKDKPVNYKIWALDAKKANDEWKHMDWLEIRHQIPENAGTVLASTATNAALSPGVNGAAGLGLFALGLLLDKVSEPDEEPYMRERNAVRDSLMPYYFRDTTLQSGETLESFVIFKYKGGHTPSSTTITLLLNGEPYTLNF